MYAQQYVADVQFMVFPSSVVTGPKTKQQNEQRKETRKITKRKETEKIKMSILKTKVRFKRSNALGSNATSQYSVKYTFSTV